MALPAGWLTDRLGVRATLASGGHHRCDCDARHPHWSRRRSSMPRGRRLRLSVLNPSGQGGHRVVSPRRRGFAMGIKQTGSRLGLIAALTMPPLALHLGWRRALATAGRSPALRRARHHHLPHAPPPSPRAPRSGREWRSWDVLRRPGVVIVFLSGLALSIAIGRARVPRALRQETSGVGSRRRTFLALAQVGGTQPPRLGAITTASSAAAAAPASDQALSAPPPTRCWARRAVPLLRSSLAVVAGAGASAGSACTWRSWRRSWVRYAGLLTGVAVAFSWSGVLVGPPIFGLVLQATGSYTAPWLILAGIGVAVAITLPRPRPLVQRD